MLYLEKIGLLDFYVNSIKLYKQGISESALESIGNVGSGVWWSERANEEMVV